MSDELKTLHQKINILEAELKSLLKENSELKEIKKDFYALLENTPDFVYIKDIEHRFTSLSQALAIITKHEHWKDVVGKTDFDIFPAEHAQTYFQQQKVVIENGIAQVDLEEPYYGEDGELRWVSTTKKPIYDENGNITGLIGISRDVTDKKKNEEKMKHIANHDSLTDLPNRSLFLELSGHAINLAKRKQKKFALLFLDLDGFKGINDQHGHKAGDQVLITIGSRVKAILRESDIISRIGGDEFIILLPIEDKIIELKVLAEKIIKQVTKAIEISPSKEVNVGCSVGAAVYPDDGEKIDQLISAADKAMYIAKNKGRNLFEQS